LGWLTKRRMTKGKGRREGRSVYEPEIPILSNEIEKGVGGGKQKV